MSWKKYQNYVLTGMDDYLIKTVDFADGEVYQRLVCDTFNHPKTFHEHTEEEIESLAKKMAAEIKAEREAAGDEQLKCFTIDKVSQIVSFWAPIFAVEDLQEEFIEPDYEKRTDTFVIDYGGEDTRDDMVLRGSSAEPSQDEVKKNPAALQSSGFITGQLVQYSDDWCLTDRACCQVEALAMQAVEEAKRQAAASLGRATMKGTWAEVDIESYEAYRPGVSGTWAELDPSGEPATFSLMELTWHP